MVYSYEENRILLNQSREAGKGRFSMTDNVIKGNSTARSTLAARSKRVILALQHLIAMFGATVLVPMITGFNPSVALFSAGVGTLIFHFCTKGKVPAFLGSSFAFIPVILTVKELFNGDLAYAQGGIVAAGLLYILMSFIVSKIGVERVQKVLAPQIVGPMIIVIGLNLVPTAIDMASQNFILAGIVLSTALLINFLGKGFFKQLGILIAVVGGYFISLQIGIVDTAPIAQASFLAIPSFQLPKFDIGAIAIIAPVVLAVFMEHVGDVTTNGQVVGKNFIKDPGLNRTLIGDGIATAFAGLIGGPANTTYGENTGVLAITKNYDPSILRIAALFAIVLALVAKLGGVLLSIPNAVMGGISFMLFSMIALVGVKTIKNEKVKFNPQNIIVMATIIILGLFSSQLSNVLGFTIGIQINETVAITGLSFAAIVGILLNAVLNIKTKKITD